MELRNHIPVVIMAFYAAIAGGCVAHNTLRKNLYSEPTSMGPKAGAHIVLILNPGPAEKIRHKEMPWTSTEVDLRGYPEAATGMLSSLYSQVSIASSAAQAQNADFIVSMSTDYPRTVGLTFQDRSGAVIANFSKPGYDVPKSPDSDSLGLKIITPPAMVVSFGTLGLGLAYIAYDSGQRIGCAISDATAKALIDLRQEISMNPALESSRKNPTADITVSDLSNVDLKKAGDLEQKAARLRKEAAELEDRARKARGSR